MPEEKSKPSQDRALGMNQPICRRDFLNASLLASGQLLTHGLAPAHLLPQGEDWTGYGGVGDYAHSNGNTEAVVTAGHRIRDNAFPVLPASALATGEEYDLVVVGGGISGLAAALFFQRQTGGRLRCLVIDNHPIFGGEAKRNEFLVDGQRLIAHQGSAFFPVPYPYSFIARFYDMIGMDRYWFDYQKWDSSEKEIPLSQTPYDMVGAEPATYGLFFGAKFGQNPGLWLTDPWGKNLEGAPIPVQDRAELLRWWKRENPAARSFQRPVYEGDAISRQLDTITLEQHLMDLHGIRRETIRTYLSPEEGGGYGLGPDALSAYCAYAADVLHPLDTGSKNGGQMFPGGNTGFARLITKTLIPEAIAGERTIGEVCRNRVNFAALDQPGSNTRIRLRSTAVWVEHEGRPETSHWVRVGYTRDGQVELVKARSVVMAGGCWTTRHIVRDLPPAHQQAYAQFYRSPCIMANVAVRNWRFLYNMGISGGRWFEGLGRDMEVRKLATFGAPSPGIGPDSPVVLTVKILFAYPGMPIDQQGYRGRYEVISTPYRDYERQLREQFTEMFQHSGFDAKRDIAGIILNRWGHAYVNPQPGFFFGSNGQPAPRELLRSAPFGRIAFANTDLAGAADHRNSILEAYRAVGQLLDQVLVSAQGR